MATRGFTGKGRATGAGTRLPPGQFITEDFPVLSAGPTPRVALENWRFTLKVGPKPVKQWSWREFISLPVTGITRDIHCVTKWSKFDTAWEGVSIDDLLADAGIEAAYRVRPRPLRRRLFDERADEGSRRRPRDGRRLVRRQADPGAITAAPPVCWSRTSTSGSRRSG